MAKDRFIALQAIERLVGGDLGMEMEFLLTDERLDKTKIDPRLLDAAKIITEVYCIAHSEVAACSHEDWEQKKFTIMKILGDN